MGHALLCVFALSALEAATTPPAAAAPASQRFQARVETGKATYYAGHFEGRLTASGAVFRHAELTAAHPTFPFGTLVRVTSLNRGRSVVVRITDRGPSAAQQRRGTIIDVSRSAAAELGMMRAGRIAVKLEVLEWGGSGEARPRWVPRKPGEAPAAQTVAAPRPQT